jgi:DNA-binding FadR family transcriptional regulator
MAKAKREPVVSASRNLTYGMLDTLGKTIVTGGYDAVPFPTEAELARQYAVSRSVTREAVKMLTAKGLLTARPRKGTTVQPRGQWNLFDPDILRWILDRQFSLDLLRQFTELRIASSRRPRRLPRWRRSRREWSPSGRLRADGRGRGGPDDPLEADIAFHIAILARPPTRSIASSVTSSKRPAHLDPVYE